MISSAGKNGPNIARITLVCSWIFVVISLLAVGLVLWSRHSMRTRLRADDYLMILALLTSMALVSQTTWAILDEGMDEHEAEIQRTKFTIIVRSLLVNETLWGLVNTFVRVSGILLITAAFGFQRTIWRITKTLLALSVLYGLCVLLEAFLICRPMAANWNPHVDGTCGDQIVSYLALEIIGLLLDFSIILIPPPMIWGSEMKLQRKVGFTIVFSIGILVFVITGLRIQALHLVNADDFTYSQGYLGLLSALGSSLGIVFCCAPTVLRIFYKLWKEESQTSFWNMRVNFRTRNTNNYCNSTRINTLMNNDVRVSTIIPFETSHDSNARSHTDLDGLHENQNRSTRGSMGSFNSAIREEFGDLRKHHTF